MEKLTLIALLVFNTFNGALLEDILLAEGGALQLVSLCSERRASWDLSAHVRQVAAMALHPAGDRAFISELGTDSPRLLLLRLNQSRLPQPVPMADSLGLLEGLAVSKRLNSLFATDATNRSIVQLPLTATEAEPLTPQLVHLLPDDRPRALALHDERGLLFWTNWRFGRQSVERSHTDGSARQPVVSSDLYLPAGVALDPQSDTLFFLDSDSSGKVRVEATSVTGAGRRVLYSGHHRRAGGLQRAGRRLYWWDVAGVWRLPVAGGAAELVLPRRRRPDAVLVTRAEDECVTYSPQSSPAPTPAAAASASASASASSSACHNFCLHGACVESELGGALCRCDRGFSGLRCQRDVCYNYCLSGGACSVTGEGGPLCSCRPGWTGRRCQLSTGGHADEEDSSPPQNASAAGPLSSEWGVAAPAPLVWGLRPAPLSALLLCLLLLLALMAAALALLAVRLRRAVVAYSPPAYVSASAPRRIVGGRKLRPRSGATRQPDIEDCCMMTLCETPCVKTAPGSNKAYVHEVDANTGGEVPTNQQSCSDRQTLAELF